MQDKHFVEHESCPNCGSQDNVAVWSDGQKYCFGCGEYTAPKTVIPFPEHTTIVSNKAEVIELPKDCTNFLPAEPSNWLQDYGINFKDVTRFDIKYSKDRELLIFPLFDSQRQLVFWQGRYFGKDKRHPKYITRGSNKDVLDLHIADSQGENVVVVEDKVSAIKVGRVYNCCCLYGSQLSGDTIAQLTKNFKSLTIWLDYDKIQDAFLYQKQYNPYFQEVNVVNTIKDPKYHTNMEIHGILRTAHK